MINLMFPHSKYKRSLFNINCLRWPKKTKSHFKTCCHNETTHFQDCFYEPFIG
uniref:Uncharacterized protein n=1 Tax=Anguilla anguilla TaxID=7936 RepID=A0A0E9PRP2_ANGAN